MASAPIASWQIDRETMETVTNFIFLGSKTTVDETEAMKLKDPCSMEEKLLTNLDKVLKSRNITLPTKVHLVKAMASSSHVWM